MRSVLFLAALVMLGCKQQPRPEPAPPTSTGPAGSPREVPPDLDLTKVTPEVKVTAQVFYDTCKRDADAAIKQYAGKVVEVSGAVTDLSERAPRGGLVHLKADNDGLSDLVCHTVDGEPWLLVVPGQVIKVRGVYQPDSPRVTLERCVFIDLPPSPAIAVAASQLAKEVSADVEQAIKKYHSNYAIVEGQVTENDVDKRKMSLKVEDGITLCYHYTLLDADRCAAVKAGQKVKIYGECRIQKPKEVTLGGVAGRLLSAEAR